MPNDDASFARVWAEFDDERLESTRFDYVWLAATGPNSHAIRIAQLQAESRRRARADLIDRARERVAASVAKRLG
jgi:hypothetical protein